MQKFKKKQYNLQFFVQTIIDKWFLVKKAVVLFNTSMQAVPNKVSTHLIFNDNP